MDLLPPETLVEILQKVPRVGQYIARLVSKHWHDVIKTYVSKDFSYHLIDKTTQTLQEYLHTSLSPNKLDDDDYIEYMYSADSSIQLVDWINELIPDGLTMWQCRDYAVRAMNVDVMAAMNRIHAVEFSLDELYKIDEVYVSGNGNYLYSRLEDRGPVNLAKFLRHSGLKMDWWALIKSVYDQGYWHWRIRGQYIRNHDRQRIKLLFTKIILETRWTAERMFLELAQRDMNVDLMGYLLDVYTGNYTLSKAAMVDLFEYPDHFARANMMGILPPFSAEFIVAKSNDLNAVARAATAISTMTESYPRKWAGLCAVICRDDALTLRYFNEHRVEVRECITQAIDYARANRLNDILKLLSGYKNSRFSQLYDFVIMRVNDKRKTLTQRGPYKYASN